MKKMLKSLPLRQWPCSSLRRYNECYLSGEYTAVTLNEWVLSFAVSWVCFWTSIASSTIFGRMIFKQFDIKNKQLFWLNGSQLSLARLHDVKLLLFLSLDIWRNSHLLLQKLKAAVVGRILSPAMYSPFIFNKSWVSKLLSGSGKIHRRRIFKISL